ncbi:MAG: electron transport complex subunit RsxE [Candidatus Fimenecus sp.]
MAEQKIPLRKEFTKGIIKENPVLRLVLGTCPTLATTTSLESAIGMGISAAIVLICSNIVISALRKIIPAKVRIPCYIVVIAGFVTIVQMLVKAFLPDLNNMLGVYLPLIVVNCIILGRAEAFAGKNSVVRSALDGLGMGVGFTSALVVMGAFRELFGSGTLLNHRIMPSFFSPMTILVMAPGGFFTYGLIMALVNRLAEKKGKKKAVLPDCSACPMASSCAAKAENEEKEVLEGIK